MPKVLHELSDMEFDEISTVPSGDNIHAKIVLAKAAPSSLQVHTNTPNLRNGKKGAAVKPTPPFRAKNNSVSSVVVDRDTDDDDDLDEDDDTGDDEEDDDTAPSNPADDSDNEDTDDWGDLMNNGEEVGRRSTSVMSSGKGAGSQGNGMNGDEANAIADQDDEDDAELGDDLRNAAKGDANNKKNSQNESRASNRARKGVGGIAEGAQGLLPVSYSRSRKAMEKAAPVGHFAEMSYDGKERHLREMHGVVPSHRNFDQFHVKAHNASKLKIPHVHTGLLIEKSFGCPFRANSRLGMVNHLIEKHGLNPSALSGKTTGELSDVHASLPIAKCDNRFAGMTKAEIKKAIVSKGPFDLILRHGRKKAGLGIGNICPHCGGLLGGKADPTLHVHGQCEFAKNARGNILDHLEVYHNKRGLRGKGLRGLVVFHRVLHEHGSFDHDVTSRSIVRPKEIEKGAHWGGDARPPKPSVSDASHIRIQHGVDPGAGKNLVAMHERLHKIGKIAQPHDHPGLFGLGKSDISKRDFDPGVGKHGTDRDKLDASDFAMPGERLYPIMCQQDVTDALRLSGKHPGVRPAIIALAKRKGFSVPDDSEVKKCVITKSAACFQLGIKKVS